MLRPCYPSLFCPVISGSFSRFFAGFRRFLNFFAPLQGFTGAMSASRTRTKERLLPTISGCRGSKAALHQPLSQPDASVEDHPAVVLQIPPDRLRSNQTP